MYNGISAVFGRELRGFFQTPVAYVFIALFLLVTGAFTFYLGNFFPRGKADLQPFFDWHPWIYLFFLPAVSMRLWSEERRTGTIEMLYTLPIPLWQTVVGKFLAAWCFAAITLCLTFPFWLTVNYLGAPDNEVILGSYFGSLLLAGGYLAIGCCFSAATQSQVVAFVLSAVVCFAFAVSGFPMVINFFSGWLPPSVTETIALFSFVTYFRDITRGILEARSLFYFATLIAYFLFLTLLILEARRR